MLGAKTGTDFAYVPVQGGTAGRITGLLNKSIDLGGINMAAARTQRGDGSLKAIAIAAEERSDLIPDVPALKELGVDMTYSLTRGIMLGPMAGQSQHYLHFIPGKSEYAEERFSAEVQRLYSVLNTQLNGQDYIVGEYSIADMACWPWVSRYEWQQINLVDYPNVQAWYRRILDREGVQKGYHVPKVMGEIPQG